MNDLNKVAKSGDIRKGPYRDPMLPKKAEVAKPTVVELKWLCICGMRNWQRYNDCINCSRDKPRSSKA